MKILFCEIKPNEKKYFEKALKEHDLIFTPLEAEEYLEGLKGGDGVKGIEMLSIFIYSNLTPRVLAQFPKLKLIATRSTGTDHIDLKECKRRRIEVKNVPEYGTNTVAEHTWALILSLTRKLYESTDRIKEKASFSREGLCGRDVFGKVLGVVGGGKIGSRVGEIGRAFGCSVIVYDPFLTARDLALRGFVKAGLEDLYRQSDIISFHTPLNKETEHLLSRKDVQGLKKGVLVVNTARGGLIETKALLDGLHLGIIAGVGLDVLEEEEAIQEEAELFEGRRLQQKALEIILQNHILLKDPRVIVTPHNAFNSEEALQRIMEKTLENIKELKQ